MGFFLCLLIAVCYATTIKSKSIETSLHASDAKNNCLSDECPTLADFLTQAIDRSIDPCDNFHDYVCDRWIKANPVSKQGMKNVFTTLEDQIFDRVKKALDRPIVEITSQAEKNAKIYYESCKSYYDAIFHTLTKMRKLSMSKNFNDEWSLQTAIENVFNNVHPPLFWWIDKKDDQPFVIDCGTSTFDFNRYDDLEFSQLFFQKIIDSEINWGSNQDSIKMDMKRVLEFEHRLANITSEAECIRSIHKRHPRKFKQMNLIELGKEMPFIKWTDHFIFNNKRESINGQTMVKVMAPEYFRKLNMLIKNYTNSTEGKITLNNYLIWRSLNSMPIDHLKDAKFKVWYHCIKEIEGNMFWTIRSIIAREVDQKAYPIVNSMFEEIRRSFIEKVNNFEWMDSETKTLLTVRANSIQPKLGHPDFVVDPVKLDEASALIRVEENDYVHNRMLFSMGFGEMPSPDDVVDTWRRIPTYKSTFDSNDEGSNYIFLPDTIIQKPMIDVNKPLSMNYGRFGTNIAHEMMHAFFNNMGLYGVAYDDDTNQDFATTEEKISNNSRCFIQQYGAYNVYGIHVNGRVTLAENVADNEGLRIAYRAYLNVSKDMKNNSLPDIGFTDKQLFFVSFAQGMCQSVGNDNQVEVWENPHYPTEYRVTGALSNFEEFAKAFNCPKGSKMNPKKQCNIW